LAFFFIQSLWSCDEFQTMLLADDPKHAATRAELSKLVNAYSYPA
jgi:hypothetical protein